MDTQQTVQQDEQDLKSERVQQEIALVAEEPFRIWLKAERVQQPALAVLGAADLGAAALGAEVPLTSAFELTINQKQPVTIEIPSLPVVITLHGTAAGIGAADDAEPQGVAG